jgi:hypothetical protein
MTRSSLRFLILTTAFSVSVGELAAQSETSKIRVESADQLPRHTYPVPKSAIALMEHLKPWSS